MEQLSIEQHQPGFGEKVTEQLFHVAPRNFPSCSDEISQGTQRKRGQPANERQLRHDTHAQSNPSAHTCRDPALVRKYRDRKGASSALLGVDEQARIA